MELPRSNRDRDDCRGKAYRADLLTQSATANWYRPETITAAGVPQPAEGGRGPDLCSARFGRQNPLRRKTTPRLKAATSTVRVPGKSGDGS